MICTCTRFNLGSRLDRWNCRLFPVLVRAIERGYKIDPLRISKVVIAIKALDEGDTGGYAGAHHFKICPCHPAQNATVPLRMDVAQPKIM
jgi:hypothetical protein